MDFGEQCVMITGITMMQQLCADNWGSLWVCLAQVLKTTYFLNLHSLSCYFFFLVTSALHGYQHNFGRGTDPTIFLDGLGCSGTESSLLSCSHWRIRFNWCSHYEDVGVVCPCRLDVYSWLLDVQGISDDYLLIAKMCTDIKVTGVL